MFHTDTKNPFRYYDPRSLGCYKELKVPKEVIIPTTDNGAWEYFKDRRWVYNKVDVVLSQEMECGPMGVAPKQYPVFIKPVYNLHGAGVGARILESKEDYDNYKHLSGYFWMEYLEGKHLSHDLVIIQGEVVFNLSFEGHSLGQGMFDFWETIETPSQLLNYLKKWIAVNLKDYTGCLNIETIGDKIIECHLRLGDIDRLGNMRLMQNIVDVYSGKEWNFNEKIPKFYLFALWGDWNIDYKIDKDVADSICRNLTCYQIDEPTLYFQNPLGGVRIAIVCSYDKDSCINARRLLYENFTPKPRKPRIDCK